MAAAAHNDQNGKCGEQGRIHSLHSSDLRCNRARYRCSRGETGHGTGHTVQRAIQQNLPANARAGGADREPDPDLPGPQLYEVVDHAVEPNGGQEECQPREGHHRQHREATLCKERLTYLIESAHVEQRKVRFEPGTASLIAGRVPADHRPPSRLDTPTRYCRVSQQLENRPRHRRILRDLAAAGRAQRR